jgi:hypothetical protein
MKKPAFLFLFSLVTFIAFGQEDLMKELESSDNDGIDYTFQTFKGTRLVNGHTVETKPAGNLEFIFAHRFGPVKGGFYELFGLDEAQVRLGLDYGITDNLSVSIGRNSNDKTMDTYAKYKLIRQSKGARTFPFTVTALLGAGYKPFQRNKDNPEGFGTIDRLSYVSQLLIARKFSTNLSFQLMPVFIHRNAVFQAYELNDQMALGVGGRIKFTKSVALTTEYYFRLDKPENDRYKNVVGIGIDIETGGHVFQIVVTNTRGLTERAFITETTSDFSEGDVQVGFNVTRTFQLKHKKQ